MRSCTPADCFEDDVDVDVGFGAAADAGGRARLLDDANGLRFRNSTAAALAGVSSFNFIRLGGEWALNGFERRRLIL